MRPMRMSPPARSTISCPGNKAVSSSDSKHTCFHPFVTMCDPQSKITWVKRAKKNKEAGDVWDRWCISFITEMLLPEQNCRQERPHMGKCILCLLCVLLLFAFGVPIWLSRDWLFSNNAPCFCLCFKAFIPGAKQANSSSAPACRLSPTINVWHSAEGQINIAHPCPFSHSYCCSFLL